MDFMAFVSFQGKGAHNAYKNRTQQYASAAWPQQREL
jgi:hypothetical protein